MKIKKKFFFVLSLTLLNLPLQAWAAPLPDVSSEDPDLANRRARYQAEARPYAEAMFLNFMVPFGWGSFRQGDWLGGSTLLALDAAGLGLIGMSVYSALAGRPLEPGLSAVFFDYGFPLGVAMLAAGRGVGLAAPRLYAKEHNDRLRRELGLDRDLNPLAPINLQQTPTLFSYSTVF